MPTPCTTCGTLHCIRHCEYCDGLYTGKKQYYKHIIRCMQETIQQSRDDNRCIKQQYFTDVQNNQHTADTNMTLMKQHHQDTLHQLNTQHEIDIQCLADCIDDQKQYYSDRFNQNVKDLHVASTQSLVDLCKTHKQNEHHLQCEIETLKAALTEYTPLVEQLKMDLATSKQITHDVTSQHIREIDYYKNIIDKQTSRIRGLVHDTDQYKTQRAQFDATTKRLRDQHAADKLEMEKSSRQRDEIFETHIARHDEKTHQMASRHKSALVEKDKVFDQLYIQYQKSLQDNKQLNVNTLELQSLRSTLSKYKAMVRESENTIAQMIDDKKELMRQQITLKKQIQSLKNQYKDVL